MRGQIVRRIGCDAGFGGSAALLAALLALGCDSFSTASEAPPPIGVRVGSGGSTTVNTGGSGPGFPSGVVDSRTVAVSSRTPPSISGVTLLALSDGRTALVSDPDRDKITLVDFIGNFFPGVITLEEGAEPGRAVEDKSGHAYVVLRGTVSWPGFGRNGEDWLGFVFVIDAFSGTPLERNPEGTLEWVEVERILELPLWDGDRHFLPLVFDADPRPFHGVMPYRDGRMQSWSVSRI